MFVLGFALLFGQEVAEEKVAAGVDFVGKFVWFVVVIKGAICVFEEVLVVGGDVVVKTLPKGEVSGVGLLQQPQEGHVHT